MTSRGSFGKPLWFEHKINTKDDVEMIMLISQMGLEGYGIHWVLKEFLASQKEYRAHFSTIPALASRYETTTAKIEAVIKGYGLYVLEENECGEIFFSPHLLASLESFDLKCLEQKEKAKIGVKKRRIKALKQEAELDKEFKEANNKLSKIDSTVPRLSNGTAYNNILKQNRTEENYETTNETETFLFKKWLDYKSKNAKNKSAYEFKIKRDYGKGIVSIVKDFKDFKIEKLKEKRIEQEQENFKKFIGKNISLKNHDGLELSTSIIKIENVDGKIKIHTEQGSPIVDTIYQLEQAVMREESKQSQSAKI